MSENQSVKLVVWDLDQTLWNGILSEGDIPVLKSGIKAIIKTLDERGILQSVCSKNNYDKAKEQLIRLGIDEYFIYSQINWNPKSENIKKIIKSINISPNAVAFIDDQRFELDEVKNGMPEVLCIHSDEICSLLSRKELTPEVIVPVSMGRRLLYMADIKRQQEEENYIGTREEFLHTLKMQLKLNYAKEEDLQRLRELTIRTHQLNSTGRMYSYEQLKEFMSSSDYMLVAAELNDIYGTYGKIGMILVKCEESQWMIELLITSCRVMTHGIGGILLGWLLNLAATHHVWLRAKFTATQSNRIMYLTFKMKGFVEIEQQNDTTIFQCELNMKAVIPDYIKIEFVNI